MATDQPACAGKPIEEHREPVFDGLSPHRWRCADCGDRGCLDLEAFARRLMHLMPLYQQLQEQWLHHRAVILLPTEGATGKMGTFMGLDVIRVPGLAEPMIGLPELKVPDLTEQRCSLEPMIAIPGE